MLNKFGSMSISAIIMFICLLLIALVAAGVLINTSVSYQEQTLISNKQSDQQYTGNFNVILISASDGTDGFLENFTQIMKLMPGANTLNLESTSLMFDLNNASATLTYAGPNALVANNLSGYYTIRAKNFTYDVASAVSNGYFTINMDYDLDKSYERLHNGYNGSNLLLNLSSLDGTSDTTVLGSCATTSWVSNITNTSYVETAIGTCSGNNVSTIYLVPVYNGYGFFVSRHLHRSTNYKAGGVQSGETIQIYYEAPRAIENKEDIRIKFIPPTGNPVVNRFTTPDLISHHTVYLYPLR